MMIGQRITERSGDDKTFGIGRRRLRRYETLFKCRYWDMSVRLSDPTPICLVLPLALGPA